MFEGGAQLGAANLRGTGFAVHDAEDRELQARDGGVERSADINVQDSPLLLARTAAAHSRRKPKHWYGIAAS